MKNLYKAFGSFCVTIISPLASLWARIYIGLIFWRSGVAKFDDLESTVENFDPAEDGDFILSFLPQSLPPEIPAYLATFGELVLPILLFVGLFTRIGALGLFIMTVVIQFFVPGFESHENYLWMIILAMLMAQGGGKISLDNWLLKDHK
ncbi:MAG: putative oxidoreductase [Arenicella sp.]|jgi:putative oxidoreductase